MDLQRRLIQYKIVKNTRENKALYKIEGLNALELLKKDDMSDEDSGSDDSSMDLSLEEGNEEDLTYEVINITKK